MYCVILLFKDEAEQMEQGKALSEFRCSSPFLYLICPFSFAIILFISLSLSQPRNTHSFVLLPLCVVDTFTSFALSVIRSLGPEHSSV